MLDLTKLTPMPWTVDGPKSNNGLCDVRGSYTDGFAQFPIHNVTLEVANLVAALTSDFEVKQRRGWHTERCDNNFWQVDQLMEIAVNLLKEGKISVDAYKDMVDAGTQSGHDVGLLTKADAWMRAHEAKLGIDLKEQTP